MTVTTTIMVTGSREFSNYGMVASALDKAYGDHLEAQADQGSYADTFTVIHGGARGADQFAHMWCQKRRKTVSERIFKPNYDQYGKKAPIVRNIQMIQHGPDMVLAFFKQGAGNRGTGFTADKARGAGIRVIECTQR